MALRHFGWIRSFRMVPPVAIALLLLGLLIMPVENARAEPTTDQRSDPESATTTLVEIPDSVTAGGGTVEAAELTTADLSPTSDTGTDGDGDVAPAGTCPGPKNVTKPGSSIDISEYSECKENLIKLADINEESCNKLGVEFEKNGATTGAEIVLEVNGKQAWSIKLSEKKDYISDGGLTNIELKISQNQDILSGQVLISFSGCDDEGETGTGTIKVKAKAGQPIFKAHLVECDNPQDSFIASAESKKGIATIEGATNGCVVLEDIIASTGGGGGWTDQNGKSVSKELTVSEGAVVEVEFEPWNKVRVVTNFDGDFPSGYEVRLVNCNDPGKVMASQFGNDQSLRYPYGDCASLQVDVPSGFSISWDSGQSDSGSNIVIRESIKDNAEITIELEAQESSSGEIKIRFVTTTDSGVSIPPDYEVKVVDCKDDNNRQSAKKNGDVHLDIKSDCARALVSVPEGFFVKVYGIKIEGPSLDYQLANNINKDRSVELTLSSKEPPKPPKTGAIIVSPRVLDGGSIPASFQVTLKREDAIISPDPLANFQYLKLEPGTYKINIKVGRGYYFNGGDGKPRELSQKITLGQDEPTKSVPVEIRRENTVGPPTTPKKPDVTTTTTSRPTTTTMPQPDPTPSSDQISIAGIAKIRTGSGVLMDPQESLEMAITVKRCDSMEVVNQERVSGPRFAIIVERDVCSIVEARSPGAGFRFLPTEQVKVADGGMTSTAVFDLERSEADLTLEYQLEAVANDLVPPGNSPRSEHSTRSPTLLLVFQLSIFNTLLFLGAVELGRKYVRK